MTNGAVKSKPERHLKKSEFDIPSNLNEAQSQYEQIQKRKSAQQVNQVEEAAAVYQLNQQITIDQQRFEQLINSYTDSLKQQNKMNLASGLQQGKSTLKHNHWTLRLSNEVMKGMLEREKEGLLIFLREKLQIPDLYLTVEVDESEQSVNERKPYTNEEKLKEMSIKNPSLKKLQKIFKTRIIYR